MNCAFRYRIDGILHQTPDAAAVKTLSGRAHFAHQSDEAA